MERLLITNNDRILDRYNDSVKILYLKGSYMDVLLKVRDKIHLGYKLLTHPMAGSLKPNQTPYRSVLLEKSGSLDYDSIRIIENSIESAKKFLNIKKVPNWPKKILEDFKTIDLSLIEYSVMKK